MRNDPEFMAYLEDCVARAREGRSYSLEEIKTEFGISHTRRKPTQGKEPNRSHRRRAKKKYDD